MEAKQVTHTQQQPKLTSDVSQKKIALVTGSATGIGANIAKDLVSAGYLVIVTGRDTDKLSKVVQLCNTLASPSSDQPAAVSFKADLSDLRQVDKLIEFINTKFNRLDVLINNACWRGDHKDILAENSYDDFKKVMHINVTVPMYLIQKCLLPLASERAVIVNISSAAAKMVVPLHLYSISKACLSEMTRQIAAMTKETNVMAVTVSPGPVLTDERPHHSDMSKLTLMNRVGTTQEISNLVLFALSHAEMFNGQELGIDGGYSAKQKQ